MNRVKSYFAPRSRAGAPPAIVNPTGLELDDGPLSPPAAAYLPSGASSRPASIYPDGDFRNEEKEKIEALQVNMMANYLYQDMIERMWCNEHPGEGVMIKKRRGDYTCCPEDLEHNEFGLFRAVMEMNVKCALTVNTAVIKLFVDRTAGGTIPLSKELRLQIIPTIQDLPKAQKHHFAAFIEDLGILVVWDDSPTNIIARTAALEERLLKMVWEDDHDEKPMPATKEEGNEPEVTVSEVDYDAEVARESKRPTRLIDPICVALTLMLLIGAMGFGFRNLAYEVMLDGNYIRLALVLYTPVTAFLSLFFMQVIVGNLFQIFGPVGQVQENSNIYSAKKPTRLIRSRGAFPHVTIQCPVYKEGLHSVIEPTVTSIKQAISTYEMQGGTANIFINDDGMQLISSDEAMERREFYDEHNIGWVSRPKHNPNPTDGSRPFLRRGKFKKASNMNYALMISNKVEDLLVNVNRPQSWTQDQEKALYEECLQDVLLQEEGRAQAAGNIRIGDYVLLIDSDTRVPSDCLLDAASEMEHSPEVAIIQFSSGVMQVANDYFENGVTFFTNLIYSAIKYTVSGGGVCPFVGHNAILRWKALQEVVFEDEDGYEKFWSESHVSEDFDMALRLQVAGYIIRLASYTGEGFKEGVSLTVYDELARWEKYAYGCNELLFHPVRYWVTRGPFTPLFRKFLGSNIRITSKIAILGYIGTYYAIGAAWILTLANYFIIGWWNGYEDKFYLESFRVYISIVVVFNGLGNVALAAMRYRLEEKSFFGALIENFKWVLMFTIFLGGLSLHVSQALLSHMFGFNMSWGATAKEVENTTFFEEAPKVLRQFKGTFIFCFGCIAMIVAGACFAPPFWRIIGVTSIFPLAMIVFCHLMLPIVLNPPLMKFTF